MKTTTRLYDIVESIFKNNCISDLENECKNQITFLNPDFSYYTKLMNFDEDTYNLMNKHFFRNNLLKSKKADYNIKKIFFNKFINREIGRQTFEIFLSELVHILYMYDDVLSFYYDNIDLYMASSKKNIVDNTNSTTTNSRGITSTFPQNAINLDVNNDFMEYGDNNTIQKVENLGKGYSKNTLSDYDYKLLENIINNNIINKVMIKIDKKCFLQVW